MSGDDALQRFCEAVWTEREDVIYRRAFGDLGAGVFTAGEVPYARMKRAAVHPGWLHHGVFACPPHGERTGWLYVTSGLSNPWNLAAPGRDPSGHSGLGFELCLLAPACADWAVQLLHNLMAWQLLVGAGAMPGQPLDRGQRVPLGGPLTGSAGCALTWLLVEPGDEISAPFELASGKVELLLLVGATETEVEFARGRGQPALVELLRERAGWPLTDPARASMV
jgi:Suppressor of fused protein (SUFU)